MNHELEMNYSYCSSLFGAPETHLTGGAQAAAGGG